MDQETLLKVVAAITAAAQPSKKESRELLTVMECCRKYKISRWTLGRWRKQGYVVAKKFSKSKSGKVLVDEASVIAYLATLTDPTVSGDHE